MLQGRGPALRRWGAIQSDVLMLIHPDPNPLPEGQGVLAPSPSGRGSAIRHITLNRTPSVQHAQPQAQVLAPVVELLVALEQHQGQMAQGLVGAGVCQSKSSKRVA